MKIKMLLFASVLLAAFANLNALDSDPSAPAKDSELSAAVDAMMQDLMRRAETLDAEKTLDVLSRDKGALFFLDSKPYSREELVHYLGSIYRNLKSMKTKMDNICVKKLGPDAAVWIAVGKSKSQDKSRKNYEEYLTETWIWQKKDGKWEVVHSHESVAILPDAEKKEKVERALNEFAVQLQNSPPKPEETHNVIEDFLAKNPEILGSAYATNPDTGRKSSDYSFRMGGKFERKNTPSTYDYTEAEWFERSARTGKPHWSEPYYDIDGASTFMITCSVPVYGKDKVLLGVVTADISF